MPRIKKDVNVKTTEVETPAEDFAFGDDDIVVDEKTNRQFIKERQTPPMPLGATREELGEEYEEVTETDEEVDDEELEDELDDSGVEIDEEDEDLEELEDETEELDEETDEEVLQISEKEHKKLIKLEKDALITKIVQAREFTKNEQSKKDVLINAIGTDFANEIFAGKVGHVAKRLLSDLKDEVFQKYIVDFYDTHNIKDGRYTRTKDVIPSIGVLEKYQKLIFESQQIDPQSFMDRDEAFEPNDSFVRGTKSYIAREKYEMKRDEIKKEINEILNTSEKQSSSEQKLVSESAKRAETEFGKLKLRFKSLQNPKTEDDFKTFLSEARNEPITSFWYAYLYGKHRKSKLTNLDQNETRAIKTGGKKLKIRGKKVKTRPVKTKGLIEDDIFGDL